MNKEFYEKIVKLSSLAYAHHKIILDENKNPTDYIYLEVNKSFEKITGLKEKDIINKKVTEVLPEILEGDFDWINFFGNVAINQTEETFEQYVLPLNKWYKGQIFSTEKDCFAITFTEIITEHKISEYAKDLNDYNYETIDYKKIIDNVRDVSGADYAFLNIFDENGKDFYTKAVSGINENFEKASNILGFDFKDKKWNYDFIRDQKTKDKKTTTFNNIRELMNKDIPKSLLKIIEKTFNLGIVVVVKTTKEDKMVGVFTLIFKKNNKLKNKFLVEAYADLLGMTINRINAEKDLKKSERNIRKILENSPDIVARFDRSFKHLYINPTIEKHTGISMDKFIGKTNEDLGMPEKLVDLWNNKLNFVFLNGKETEIFFNYTTSEGEKYYHSKIVPEFDDKNKAITALSITRDITKLKKAEEELNIAKLEAERANKSKSLFLSKITHDLKMPLNAISGFSSLIKDELLDENHKEYINIIIYSSRNMLDLINDLLDISKIEACNLVLNKKNFNIFNEIEELIKSMSIIIKQKGNKIFVNINDEMPKILIGDNYRLNRIIQNLLANSNRFTYNGEIKLDITLEKETHDSYIIKFIVSDTGIGIEKEKLKKIFVPYYQAHDFDGNGTGLGLALCKELVELMNGEIFIESEIDKGTKVAFTVVFEKDIRGIK